MTLRKIGEAILVLDNSIPETCKLVEPLEMLKLADAFSRGAHVLPSLGEKGKPISRAPARLSAIHGIELYLSTLLIFGGCSPKAIKRMHHDLGARALVCRYHGLILSGRTVEHLNQLTVSKEYIVSRYEPEIHTELSQTNRFMATPDEVSEKTAKLLLENGACAESGRSLARMASITSVPTFGRQLQALPYRRHYPDSPLCASCRYSSSRCWQCYGAGYAEKVRTRPSANQPQARMGMATVPDFES